MGYIVAQIAEEPAYDPVFTIIWLSLLCVPLLLLIPLLFWLTKYNRRVRSHIDRTEKHMDRVESLLEQIADNTKPKAE